MQIINYTIKDKIGFHARPIGELIKKAKEFNSVITISKNGNKTGLGNFFAILKLNIKFEDEIEITVDGSDEVEAAAAIKAFLEERL
ncbi:MAG: HPr family phosphocarrier protein [Spirochaetaceae bacterium]|jgi:phosphocarrier protein|nr:HPr family phosphocarrier protein [Spirochaetaceae bacterium]